MARVLVTGANGHIGANTVRSLLKRGHTPVPFVRSGADLRGLSGLELEFCYGDVLDYESLARAAAVETGQAGERYIVGEENIPVKEAAALIKKLTGEKPVHLGITGPLTIFTAACVELVAKLTGSEPPFEPQIIRDTVGRYHYLDCSSARRAFGLVPRAAEEILRDTVRWLLHLGAVRPSTAQRLAAEFPPDPEWV